MPLSLIAPPIPAVPPVSARKSGARLLKQPEVETEIRRLRELGQAAAVLDLAKKREFLASIINDPEQKTSDRLRALKLDAELAGDIDTSLISPQEEVTGAAMQMIQGITHAGDDVEVAEASRSAVAERQGQACLGDTAPVVAQEVGGGEERLSPLSVDRR